MEVSTYSGRNGISGGLNGAILTKKVVQREIYNQSMLAAISVRRDGPWTVGLGRKSQVRQ